MNYIHNKGFVHRDLKPENICLEQNNFVKIIDFGTARKFTKGKKLRQVIGTPFYMAPEIFNEKKYNEKADIWSLGIVMYILLTGKAPYFGNNDEKITQQAKKGIFNRKLLLESKISRPAINLIDNLLMKNYRERLSAE
jgi:calcium-dependent protein kinase